MCVGEEGFEEELQALTPGQPQPSSFDVHGNFSPHFLPGWCFSHFGFDCFLNNSKS